MVELVTPVTDPSDKSTSTKPPRKDGLSIASARDDPPHPDNEDVEPLMPGKKKRGKGKVGKKAEDEVRRLLDETLSLTWRVWDTRNFAGFGKGKMIGAKVRSDFEAIYLYPTDKVTSIDGSPISQHLYIEVKSSKNHSSFPMHSSVLDEKKKQQWEWAKICSEQLMDEYWYIICNRHSPTYFYLLLFDWPSLKKAWDWMDSKGKKSIPWEKLKQLANAVMYQDEESADDMRYVTPENIKTLRRAMGHVGEPEKIHYEANQ